MEGRVVSRGDVIPLNIMGRKSGLVVNSVMPSGTASAAYSISKDTEFILSSLSKAGPRGGIPRVSYEDIGGLRNEVQKVREMIELPLRHPEIFERIGIEAPKGVLLHGPPGTGKTLLAQAVANETNANYYSIAGPEIMSKFYGESEERLRDTFKQAQDNAPSIIFIDELDSIAPKRDEVSGDVEKRIVSQLLTLMDGLEARGKVVVIGATNRVNSIDPALRRPGRFDREIEIGIPDEEGRLDILHIHTRGMPLTDDVKLEYFAKITHGFVGADLESLCKEAAMRSLTRVIPEINLDQTKIPIEVLNKIRIGNKDFEEALKDIHPSAIREVQIQKPNVKWEDVGGLANVKDELSEAIEWPLKHADLFDEADVIPPKGILLYGSPGTGKTMIAKAVATNSEANFISIKGPELISKWVGGYGVYEERISNTFAPGEDMVLYSEPVGFSYKPVSNRTNGETQYLMNFTADLVITDTQGNVLGGFQDLPISEIISHHQNKEVNLVITLSQSSPFPEGNYKVLYTVHDEPSGNTFEITKDVTVSPSSNA